MSDQRSEYIHTADAPDDVPRKSERRRWSRVPRSIYVLYAITVIIGVVSLWSGQTARDAATTARDQVSENRAQDLRLAQGNYITCQVQNRQAGTARALRTIVLAISPFPRDRSPELYDALANYRKLTAKKRVPRDCGVRPVGISDEVLP